MKLRNLRKILWGIFFIGAAAVVILSEMGWLSLTAEVTLPKLVLSLVFIPIIIESLAHMNFFGVFFPLGCLAIIYAKPLGILKQMGGEGRHIYLPILVAALLLSIGFHMVFRKKKNKQWDGKYDWQNNKRAGENLTDNRVSSKVSFGGGSKYIHSQCLQEAWLKCSFGGMQVYFDGAQLHPNGAVVNVDVSFGGLELFIPKTWPVDNRINSSLGGVDEKNNRNAVTAGPMLVLTGNVSLGAVDITYV